MFHSAEGPLLQFPIKDRPPPATRTPPSSPPSIKIKKLEKAVTVRNFLLERFSGKLRSCWQTIPRFSGSAKCYPCQALGTFRQGTRLLENWPGLRERCWIFSSETATAFLSSSEKNKKYSKRAPRTKNLSLFIEVSSFWVGCFTRTISLGFGPPRNLKTVSTPNMTGRRFHRDDGSDPTSLLES